MSVQVKGFITVLVIGVAVILGIYFGTPYLREKKQVETSDSRTIKGTIRVAYDNWIGYFPLCSPEMNKLMRRSGYLWKCEDDQANYGLRMGRLKNNEIDFAVVTVDSYILNGHPKGFPGVIITVIDESKGGDAIVSRKEVVASLDDLRDRKGIRVAFTPDSPSHHLAKATADHFDLPALVGKGGTYIATNGSTEALDKIKKGAADVAVLWEPDVSRATNDPDIVKLLGTEDTQHLIVDILVVHREYSRNNPHVVHTVLSNYFRALKTYRDNQELLKKDIEKETNLSVSQVDSMLKGVEWITLMDNAKKWFSIVSPGSFELTEEGLIDTIESTKDILISQGDFDRNPLPNEDPYRLIQSDYIESLFTQGIGFTIEGSAAKDSPNSLEAFVPPLDDKVWDMLREIGTLKIQPITFQSGDASLGYQSKIELDKVVGKLKHYPHFRVVVKGHTGLKGDPIANKQLSQERAESVKRYIMVTYNVHENRIRAVGLGSDEPLPKRPGESDRAYNYRLPRVELYLVAEVY